MTTTSELFKRACEFDERLTVDSAVAASEEYAKPITEWTQFGPPIEVHEHGFYAGARFERDRTAKIREKVEAVVEAAEHPWIQELDCECGYYGDELDIEPVMSVCPKCAIDRALAALRAELSANTKGEK